MIDNQRAALRKPGLVEVRIRDTVIVYDPDAERSHRFNDSAGRIWDLIDGVRAPNAIVAELVGELAAEMGESDDLNGLGHSHHAISDGVSIAIERLGEEGLVANEFASAVPPKTVERTAPTAQSGSPRAMRSGTARSRSFAALNFSFAIEGSADIIESLDAVLRTLVASGPAEHEYCLIERGDGSYDVELDSSSIAVVTSANVIGHILLDINQRACEAHDTALLVHAAGVLTTKGVVALSGTMNAGKSTLVTGLIRAGYVYMGDEAIAVDMGTLDVIAYPKPIGIDHGSQPIFPMLQSVAAPLANQRWWVSPLDVDDATAVRNGSIHPLSAIVFLGYSPDHELAVSKLDVADTAFTLTQNLFNLRQHGTRGLEAAARLGSSVDSFSLRHANLDSAVSWFTDTFG